MRKFLSLVLALVMTMSLVTVSAGAAYKDAADIDYKEAVDVISALGVVSGNNGNFMPEGNLTRGAAAKIICNLILGIDAADDLDASATPFSDVPAGSTFGKYIAYAAKEGIVGGYGDGTFRPSNNVTGSQFVKMLLGALNYDHVTEGMDGTDYATKASVLASKRGLTDGIEKFDGKVALTREVAAQLIFNTLQAEVVEYTGGSNQEIKIGDIVISNKGKAEYEGNDKFFEANFGTLEYLEESDLEADDLDVFGRPTHGWEYKGELVGTYVDEADVVYYGAFDGADLYKDLGKVTFESEAGNVAKDSDDAFGSATGMVTYVYYTADDKTTEDEDEEALDLYQIEYVVDVVESVTDVEYDKYGDVKTEAYVTTETYGDFETTAFAKDQVVLVALDDGAIIDMVKVDSIEGKVTAKKGAEFKIGGKYYGVQDVALSNGDEGTFYLNQDGAVVKFTGISNKTDKYGYIYNFKALDDTDSEDGITIETEAATVYMVLADGSKASFKVTDADTLAAIAGVDPTTNTGLLVAYAVKDGELTIKTGDDVTDTVADAAADTVVVNKTNAKIDDLYVNSKTEFVFVELEVDDDDALTGKVKATKATGYKNVKVESGDAVWTVSNDDGEVIYAFVASAQKALEDETTYYAVLAGADAVVTEDEDEVEYFTYDVLVDGKATELTFKAPLDLDLGAVLTYTMDGEYAEFGAELVADVEVEYANSDYVVFAEDETLYNQDGAKVYLVSVDADEETVKVTSSKLVASDDDYVVTAKVAKVDSDDETVLELVFMWKAEVEEEV